MKLHRILSATAILFATGVLTTGAQPNPVVATAPVYNPDTTHANEPLKEGILAWDAEQKTIDVTNGQDFARFVFSFTNTAASQTTNITSLTNFTTVTNSSFGSNLIQRLATITSQTNVMATFPVTILDVKPSCGCTTAELPPRPWLIAPGANGQIKLNVNLAGKTEQPGIVFKTANVSTDKGSKMLKMNINVLPPPPARIMSQEERALGVAAATADRQAIFKGDCASCHVKKIEGKYGQPLFDAICAICHEANPRASMVPDLHNLKDPTSEEFWRTWITSGKAGTLMPAFATSQGGPLNDMQIASLAATLNSIIPPRPASPVTPPSSPIHTNLLPLLAPSPK